MAQREECMCHLLVLTTPVRPLICACFEVSSRASTTSFKLCNTALELVAKNATIESDAPTDGSNLSIGSRVKNAQLIW